ncbi:hypothetical protein An02g02350 [Aspergillus niger]|uniref:Uncharacterized protein n=2 Tax=Aspergillus niger TaxID=5061 RepID=A2QC56_ASPNC|nr:hypothetical protein An02g02350 [Aspergillus niger]CAK96409.1 hypothetical protein An02g02350 [Aspergillus niger]
MLPDWVIIHIPDSVVLVSSHFHPPVSPEIGDYFWDDASSCADSRGPADPQPVGIFSPVGRTVP